MADVEDQPAQSLTQKVAMLGHLARFVVIDDTDLSGHIAEVQAALANNWYTVALQGRGHATTFMIAEAPALRPTYRQFPYDPNSPDAVVEEAVRWVESVLKQFAGTYNAMYPWRLGFGAASEG